MFFSLTHVLPPTTKRVQRHTDPMVNAKIKEDTEARIADYAQCDKEILSNRIEKLNREWDTERVLEANAATWILISSCLGMKKDKRWFYVTGGIGAFLLQHALFGWCPPLPIIRRLGVRTPEEIQRERLALQLLRGDFLTDNKAEEKENKKEINKEEK